jgi:hypothetical protein
VRALRHWPQPCHRTSAASLRAMSTFMSEFASKAVFLSDAMLVLPIIASVGHQSIVGFAGSCVPGCKSRCACPSKSPDRGTGDAPERRAAINSIKTRAFAQDADLCGALHLHAKF